MVDAGGRWVLGVTGWTGAGSMLRASEVRRRGPSDGFWVWEGALPFVRAMSLRSAGELRCAPPWI